MANSGRTLRVLGSCVAGGAVIWALGAAVALWNTGLFGEEDGPLRWLGVVMAYVGSVAFVAIPVIALMLWTAWSQPGT